MNLNSVAIMSATINSATNFLLYCAFSSGFRKTFLEVLHIRSTGEFLMFERRKRLLVNIAVKVEQMIIKARGKIEYSLSILSSINVSIMECSLLY